MRGASLPPPKPTCRVSLSICISSACFSCSRRLRSPSNSSTFNLEGDHDITRCHYSPAQMEGHGWGVWGRCSSG